MQFIVLATAKIHILKQFTTFLALFVWLSELCLLLQRYTFWSNSQLKMRTDKIIRNCACYCKDTHFEAIHNHLHGENLSSNIVLATAKIHILKQFTTGHAEDILTLALCLLLQRYTFWSNSQRRTAWGISWRDCACYCKDTHFEAIHNRTRKVIDAPVLCLLLQRYTFWSNSQQERREESPEGNCACYCKDTHFEAIHNPIGTEDLYGKIVLATAKIHILKQFTTLNTYDRLKIILCLLLQRYTFWSNSQRGRVNRYFKLNCACYCKDTHFEAIHNPKKERKPVCALCLLLQRYTFWSNSQPATSRRDRESDCACYCKDTHFEAIHNDDNSDLFLTDIVLATAKIHILKQFTTPSVLHYLAPRLCLLLQRYTFWSNSQHQRVDILLGRNCACYCKDTHFEAIHNVFVLSHFKT